MTPEMLVDDCSRCAALCCWALAMDEGPSFADDKPAGRACRNLAADGRCGIHPRLMDEGYAGCAAFTCHGAGQRVTQDCFGGASWRENPHLARSMILAFASARRLHLWLMLLTEARRLPLSKAQADGAEALIARLTPAGRLDPGWLAANINACTEAAVTAYLASLRGSVSRQSKGVERCGLA